MSNLSPNVTWLCVLPDDRTKCVQVNYSFAIYLESGSYISMTSHADIIWTELLTSVLWHETEGQKGTFSLHILLSGLNFLLVCRLLVIRKISGVQRRG
jgi:hypothetical protein